MSCQHDAGEGSLCRNENNKDVFIFSTECLTSDIVCLCELCGTAILSLRPTHKGILESTQSSYFCIGCTSGGKQFRTFTQVWFLITVFKNF